MNEIIVGIGEILWDLLPSGKELGGATANFAYHAFRLGAEGWAVSAIGDDPLGEEIISRLCEKKLKTIIEVTDKPTGTVQVSLDGTGVPSYNIMEDVAWDNIPFTDNMRALAERADAICFGSLAQRMNSRQTVRMFIRAAGAKVLKIFDINLRQHYFGKEVIEESLQMADILKINDEEFKVVKDMFGLEGGEVKVCRSLIDNYGLILVILTKGAAGSEVITMEDVITQEAVEVDVVDTVGAGDAFTAAFTVCYLRGKSLSDCQRIASETAAYVCSNKGAMPK